MGSLQVEKRNAERQHLVTHRKHIDDWKKVSVCPKKWKQLDFSHWKKVPPDPIFGDSGFQQKGHPYPHPREMRNLN